MIIDYNRLKTFTTVAKLESITKAASLLHLTQQAVSSQIQLLEEDLGVLLFKRANRKIYLTKEGRRINATVSSNFTLMENDISIVVNDLNSLEDTIVIGASTEIAELMLGDLISEFHKSYPGVKFEFILGEDSQTEAGILEGRLDIGFVVFSKEVKLLEIRPYRSEEFVTVASTKFLKNNKCRIDKLVDILDYPVIDFKPECPSLRTWVLKNDKKLLKHFENKTAAFSANDDRMIKKLVLSDLGIANMPKTLVEKELSEGITQVLLPGFKNIKAGIDIISMKRKTTSLAVQKFVSSVLLSCE